MISSGSSSKSAGVFGSMLSWAMSAVSSETLVSNEGFTLLVSIAFSCGFVPGAGLELSNVVALARGPEGDALRSVLGNELYACNGRRLNSSGALGVADAIYKLKGKS